MERCLCGIFIVTCVEAAPVMSPGLGSCCASPGRMLQSSLLGRCGCPHGGVLTVIGDSGLTALGGLRLCSILCLVGDWERAPRPNLSPPCSQSMSSSWGSS